MKKSFKHSAKKPHKRLTLLKTLVVLFVIWASYRTFFHFPEWVDEVLAKAVVFGGPALLYARGSKRGEDVLGLGNARFWSGMFVGLLVGGFYEFLAVLSVMMRAAPSTQASVLTSPLFWKIFFLAIFTAWWESLFFFGYVLNALMEKFRHAEIPAILVSTGVFLLFHLPFRIVTNGINQQLVYQLLVLALFAIGQAIVYLRTKSIYAITLSHALWGLVLFVYN